MKSSHRYFLLALLAFQIFSFGFTAILIYSNLSFTDQIYRYSFVTIAIVSYFGLLIWGRAMRKIAPDEAEKVKWSTIGLAGLWFLLLFSSPAHLA